jgi:hypothetical protein
MTLDEWLTEGDITNAAFGQMIERSEATVSRIRRGLHDPDPDTARLIVAVTKNKVTLNDLYGVVNGARK